MSLYYILFLETFRGDFFHNFLWSRPASKRRANPILFISGPCFAEIYFFFRNTMVLMHLAFQAGINNASSKDLAFSQSQQI